MPPPRSPFFVTSLVAGAFFMENLDGTIIATALPQMAKSFHIAAVNLNIGMTAYLLTLAVFIPISGWVADRFGSRTVFATAIVIFTLTSLFCSLSHTLTQFTLMRILQGLGGAMMVPVGRLIALRNAPKDKLAQTIAYISWPGLSALVLGPPLGGFITTYASWHWIFLINLPIGAAAFLFTMLWVQNTRSGERHSFDWLTFAFASIGSTSFVYAMEKFGGDAGRWQLPAVLLSVGIVSGYLTLASARRRRNTSFIDLESLKIKTYSIAIFGASVFRISVSVLPFLLPLMFQITFGLSAFRSGLYLLALFAGDLSMKTFVIQVLRRFGFRRILLVNGLIVSASMFLCATLSPATPAALILAILFIHGACRSMQFTCLTTLPYTEVPPERMSRANGFHSAVMQLTMGMGIAVGAITLRLTAHARGHSASAPQLRDFHIAFICMALLELVSILDTLGLSHTAGAGTSGHRLADTETSPA